MVQRMKITARNKEHAVRIAKRDIKTIYGSNYIITDAFYLKGSKVKNLNGKIVKRYGILFRKRKKPITVLRRKKK